MIPQRCHMRSIDGSVGAAFRLRHRARAMAESAVILEMLHDKGNGDKPPRRNQSVFERRDYAKLTLEVILADVKLNDPSSRITGRPRRHPCGGEVAWDVARVDKASTSGDLLLMKKQYIVSEDWIMRLLYS